MHAAAPCGGSTRLTIRRCMLHRAGHAGDAGAPRQHAHRALSPRGLWPSGPETMRPLSAPVHEGRFGDAAYRHRGARDRDPCHRHLAVDVASRHAQGDARVSPRAFVQRLRPGGVVGGAFARPSTCIGDARTLTAWSTRRRSWGHHACPVARWSRALGWTTPDAGSTAHGSYARSLRQFVNVRQGLSSGAP